MPAALHALWVEPRPAGVPTAVRRDWTLVAVVDVLAVVETVLRPELEWRALSVVLVLVVSPLLRWRRSRPLLATVLAFGAAMVVGLATAGTAGGLYTTAVILLFPYALTRWGSGREIVLGTPWLLVQFALGLFWDAGGADDVIGGLAILLLVPSLGAAARFRARGRARVRDEIARLERERFARDLHDTVAHHVSAIAVRAQAGIATAPSDPGAATDALRVIETEATRTLAEMRTMVRVLRGWPASDGAPSATPGGAPLEPVPGLRDIERLARPLSARRDADDVAVQVVLDGDLDALGTAVGTAAYRIAQESVTNARRHARATSVDVGVTVRPDRVVVRVHDDGTGVATSGPGFGLRGMVERAHLLGGTCVAGPDSGGGWTVLAELPAAGARTAEPR